MRHYLFLLMTLAFTAGCASLWGFHHLSYLPYAGICAATCALIGLIIREKWKWLAILLFYATGFFYCYAFSEHVLQNRLPRNLEGVPLKVEGVITSLPDASSTAATHFEFLLQHMEKYTLPEEAPWLAPQKIRLSWYQGAPPLKVGQTWSFSVKLKQPRSTFNPASFDYEAWLFTHRISAIGYVISKNDAHLISTNAWKNPMASWREYIQQQLEKTLAGNPNLGMIEALSLGVRDDLTPEQWQAMQATGTNHLVAIAGLHVGFVVACVFALTQFFWRRIPLLMLYLPAREAGIFVALMAACYYSALSGFALPTQRALGMLSVALLANLFRRHFPPWHAYAIALLLILICDPLSVFSSSFWLSFIAVAVILFSLYGREKKTHEALQLFRMQWIVTLGLAPVTLYFFHQISVMNLVANAIAIPWVGFLALPCLFAGLLLLPINATLAKGCWLFAAKILSFFWPMLFYLGSMDRLQWHSVIPHLWILFSAIMGVFIFFAPKGFPNRSLGLFGFLPLLYPMSHPISLGEYQLRLLDVGQGLSVLVRTAHHDLVFDTGPRLDASYDMGESVVVPALQENFANALDMMIISHGDNDHSGGAQAVLQAMPVKILLTSVPERYANLPEDLPSHAVETKALVKFFQQRWPKPQLVTCVQGQHWIWDNVQFEILGPPPNTTLSKGNDRSCVLHITGKTQSVLLTADIEKPAEKSLLEHVGAEQLRSTILVAPHHGSKTSSSEDFIRAIYPRLVLYPTGYRNKFHFPNNEVIHRYQTLGARQEDTALSGQIQVTSHDPSVELTRQTQGNFWN